MGKAEACLLPAPHRGLAKATATHPVMGSCEPFDLESADAIRTWFGQVGAASDAGPFIG